LCPSAVLAAAQRRSSAAAQQRSSAAVQRRSGAAAQGRRGAGAQGRSARVCCAMVAAMPAPRFARRLAALGACALCVVGASAASKAAGGAVAVAANHSVPRFAWWEGDLMSMSTRRVFALTPDRVVMCYAQERGGACKIASGPLDDSPLDSARSKAARPAAAAAAPAPAFSLLASNGSSAPVDPEVFHHPNLLPAIPWGQEWRFESGSPVVRIEAERLAEDRFVVCFQRRHGGSAKAGAAEGGHSIACGVGFADAAGGSDAEATRSGRQILPSGGILELGAGRLISVSVLEAGKRFAVCHRDAGSERRASATPTAGVAAHIAQALSCRWAEAHVTAVEGHPREADLRWASDAALEVSLEGMATE